MIPIRDENPTRRPPVVTVLLIVANVAIFLWQILQPPEVQQRFVATFGSVPLLLAQDTVNLPSLPLHWVTVLTSMFLHGGIFHVGGNMLYLWIFGNNVEDHLGHLRFTGFYLLCGVAAALAHALSDLSSPIPMIGASGAISGMLGAYVILYPRARVVVLIWFVFLIRFVRVPAFLVLGVWFLMQLTGVIGQSASEGGIAFFAHIGGFVFGLLVIRLFGAFRRRRPYFV